ncbi:MAG: hypothetical protein ACTSRG_23920 [Candidatus Helarchaeota archaeon]
MVFSKTFTSDRWKRARVLQQTDFEKTGTKKSLRDYYKNDNPISQKMNKYEVTFALDYSGEGYNFSIPQESFIVYAYGEFSPKEELEEMTKQGVSSIFRGRAQGWVYDHSNVTVRGVEDIGKVKYNEIQEDSLLNNNVFTDKLPSVGINKTRKGGSTNKQKYALNIWL